MASRKQILESLLSEAQELRSSVGDSTEATQDLQGELDRLQSAMADASRDLAETTELTLSRFSDRLSDLRTEIAEALSEGGRQVGKQILQGHLVGHLVGQAIANRLQANHEAAQTDPRNIIARRVCDALIVISDAYDAGERNDYEATLRLLRVHEFKAEQARYIVDQMCKYGILGEIADDTGANYLAIDHESEGTKELFDHYSRGTLVYLP